MIYRIVTRYGELVGRPPACSPPLAYAMFDGLFQQALLRHLSGEPGAADHLRDNVVRMLDIVVRPC